MRKHDRSSLLSFIVGLLLTVLFSFSTYGLFISVDNMIGIYAPYDITLVLLVAGLDIAVPITVGHLWKSKSKWYWIGAYIGLIIFAGSVLLYEIARGIGSNPV